MAEALAIGEQLCGLGMPSVMLAKDAVNRSFETGLTEGIAYERRVFHALFGTADQREGMDAFLAKRKPEFKHR
jgi:enoyl-CoA hydratase